MKALTYIEEGRFEVREKVRPVVVEATDALVRVILSSICTSDLHIKHGSVPRAVPGVTVGHEMVGVVESVGEAVAKVKPGDRVAVNVETFCGECFFCQHGWSTIALTRMAAGRLVAALMVDRRSLCVCRLLTMG